MKRPTRILLADDGTRVTAAARQAAVDLARCWSAELHVVTVTAEGITAAPITTRTIERLCAAKRISLTHHHQTGPTAQEIASVASAIDAELLILGSHHRRGGQAPAGSVGRAALTTTAIPVLIVRSGTWPPARIVVGDDGSAEAGAAMDLAADIGSGFDACALLVDAMPELDTEVRDPALAAVAAHVAAEEAERLFVDSVTMGARLGGTATGLLSHSGPATAIRHSVEDAGPNAHVLIAVGSSGRSDFERQLGWSVSARSVNIESASILVVPRIWAVRDVTPQKLGHMALAAV